MASATTLQAATQAVQRDAAGDGANAAMFYEQAAQGLSADIAALGGAGPECDAMRAKANEYLARARVLRSQESLDAGGAGGAGGGGVGGGAAAPAAQPALAPGAAASPEGAKKAGKWQQVAGAAGAGAVGGAMVVGSVIGAPIMGAMAGAGALAYATTRDDGYGDAARTVGTATSGGVGKAREINTEFKISEKAGAAARSTAEAVQAVDAKYQVADTVSGFFSAVGRKASELDSKYDVRGKLGQGASAAGGAAAAALDGVSSTAQATTAAQGGAKGAPQAI